MPEAFDLNKMLAEIVEDEKISSSKRKKISQADIKRMLRERGQTAGGKKTAGESPKVERTRVAPSPSPRARKEESTGSLPGGSGTPIGSCHSGEPGVSRIGPWAGGPDSPPGGIIVESRGAVSPRSLIPGPLMRRHRLVPLRQDGGALILGMENPDDVDAIQEVEFLTGLRVEPVRMPGAQIEEALLPFGRDGGTMLSFSEGGKDTADLEEAHQVLRALRTSGGYEILVAAGSAPLVRSHLGLEPSGLLPFTARQCVRCARALMTEWQWEAFLQRREIDLGTHDPELGRFRVNAYRQQDSASLTIRAIPPRIGSLSELGLPSSLDSIAGKPHGLVVFTSPPGQGKTTTLNAVLHLINMTLHSSIITLEAPIEYRHTSAKSTFSQREIGKDVASLSDGLRNISRQAPDVIVIGEVRDPKSFRLALDAASAGHLVLCTLLGFNATSPIEAMTHQLPFHLQSPIRQQLAESLLMVFSQRLLPAFDRQSLIVLHETLFNSPRVRSLLREDRLSQLRIQAHQGEEDFVSMDVCVRSLLREGKIAVQDGAMLAEDPALVLGADIH